MNHILGHSSNQHLQYAIAKYGLSSFAFVILQYCKSSDLLKREQYFLDILFLWGCMGLYQLLGGPLFSPASFFFDYSDKRGSWAGGRGPQPSFLV